MRKEDSIGGRSSRSDASSRSNSRTSASDLEDLEENWKKSGKVDLSITFGPGQIFPKRKKSLQFRGDINLGFIVTKGQLEVDIVCIKDLNMKTSGNPPEIYVRTQLIDGKKKTQKKKTKAVKGTYSPNFRQKIKYSACNVNGRCLEVVIKNRTNRKCIGEVLIRLDNLDLSIYTANWYKIFPESSNDQTLAEMY